MADPKDHDSDPALSRSFDRKVRLSTLALFFERLWPRLWLLIGLGLIFAVLSFLGLWPYLDRTIHKIVLAVFALAGLTAILYAARIPWPTRDEAIRRIERYSEVPHRPATSYEDTLSSGTTSAATNALVCVCDAAATFSYRRPCWSQEASEIVSLQPSASVSPVSARRRASMLGSRRRPTPRYLPFCYPMAHSRRRQTQTSKSAFLRFRIAAS